MNVHHGNTLFSASQFMYNCTVVLFLCRHKYLFMDVIPAISNNTYRKKPFNTLKLSFFVQLTPFES